MLDQRFSYFQLLFMIGLQHLDFLLNFLCHVLFFFVLFHAPSLFHAPGLFHALDLFHARDLFHALDLFHDRLDYHPFVLLFLSLLHNLVASLCPYHDPFWIADAQSYIHYTVRHWGHIIVISKNFQI